MLVRRSSFGFARFTSPFRRGIAAATAVAAASSAAVATAGCSGDPPVLSVEVMTGHETDTFSQDPPVTRVEISARSAEGDVSVSASAAPGGTFDFGEVPVDRLLTFEVTGASATGAVVVRGRSLGGIYLGSVSGGIIPIFAQRTNLWARPPSGLARARVGAPASILSERYLFTSGGSEVLGGGSAGTDPRSTDFYDLFSYDGVSGASLPRAARSIVGRTSAFLLIDETGATWVDFQTGLYNDAALPAGLGSFGDVAGGRTIDADGGRSFVVGATRLGSASAVVLIIEADGTLGFATLTVPREGAAAVWLPSVGLVVAGGSKDGAGVEVLAPGATAFASRDFPADPVRGAGAVVTQPNVIALLGGDDHGAAAATRLFDVSCSNACAAEHVAGATLPTALTGVAAFALGSGRTLAVGDAMDGDRLTRSFLVELVTPSAVEVFCREPRRGATAVPAPNGTLALLGGVHPDGTPALTVEMLFPQ